MKCVFSQYFGKMCIVSHRCGNLFSIAYFGIVFISNIEFIVYFNWNTISYNDPVNSITMYSSFNADYISIVEILTLFRLKAYVFKLNMRNKKNRIKG